MRPIKATLVAASIEIMILASIMAAESGKLRSPEYEAKMVKYKTKIAEALEDSK